MKDFEPLPLPPELLAYPEEDTLLWGLRSFITCSRFPLFPYVWNFRSWSGESASNRCCEDFSCFGEGLLLSDTSFSSDSALLTFGSAAGCSFPDLCVKKLGVRCFDECKWLEPGFNPGIY